MGQRITILLVVFLLMFCRNNFAQQKADSIIKDPFISFNYSLVKISSVNPDFYKKNLGFFCQKELFIEKKTTIPFRFRLGSLAYVDRLEGKK